MAYILLSRFATNLNPNKNSGLQKQAAVKAVSNLLNRILEPEHECCKRSVQVHVEEERVRAGSLRLLDVQDLIAEH